MDGLQDQMRNMCLAIRCGDNKQVEQLIIQFPVIINTYHKHDDGCEETKDYLFSDKVMPLHIAVKADRYECAQLLLRYKADPNGKIINLSDSNQAPLHLAQSMKMTHLLLEHGARVDEKDAGGQTPLCSALFHVHEAKPKLDVGLALVKHGGADVNVKYGCRGQTLLHFAAYRKGYVIDVVRFLIENGADQTIVDDCGKKPLYHAKKMCSGFQELLDLFDHKNDESDNRPKKNNRVLY